MNLNNEEFEKLDIGTQQLIKWQYQMSGGFISHLFNTIAKADDGNRIRLSKGFPEEVKAYENFALVRGWWKKICEKVNLVN